MKSKNLDLNVYEEFLRNSLMEYMLLVDIEDVITVCRKKYDEFERVNIQNEKSKASKKTKKNSSKAKKDFDMSALIDNYTDNEELKQTLRDFAQMRVEIKDPLTKTGWTRLFNKLDRLCKTINDKVNILEKSIINNWKDIWQFESSTNNTAKNTTQNKSQSTLNTVKMSEEEWENIILSRNKLEEFSKTVIKDN